MKPEKTQKERQRREPTPEDSFIYKAQLIAILVLVAFAIARSFSFTS